MVVLEDPVAGGTRVHVARVRPEALRDLLRGALEAACTALTRVGVVAPSPAVEEEQPRTVGGGGRRRRRLIPEPRDAAVEAVRADGVGVVGRHRHP